MISVLMSVYNEKLSEIEQSINSVLSQSFRDFELIIVLDRPDFYEGKQLLQKYADADPRVKIIENPQNIGLAMSMNKAAQCAKGEYLLRMDADDICYPGRFQKEYDAICQGNYDLVCGNYDFIDENGALLAQKVPTFSDRQLAALLPLRNIIHHPTVIMTAELFRKVGGYRDYPCAQDYDLWLRMKCCGCKMHMMHEKLIKYRVRSNSTTVQKRYKQSCTGEYIRSLYKNNMSGYSYEGYLAFLEKKNANNADANEDFIQNAQRYADAKKQIRQGKVLQGIYGILKVLLCSRYYRPHIFNSLQIFVIQKFVK